MHVKAAAGPRRSTRRMIGVFAGVVALLIALIPTLQVAASMLQAGGDDPSPAGGHAEVIANGVSQLPAEQVAWRISSNSAVGDEGETGEEGLGFFLAAGAALLLNNFTTGTQARLAEGEAAFVQTGAFIQPVGLGSEAVEFYRIKLVPAAEAGDGFGSELVYGGEAFTAPVGNRDIDLVRDVLEEDEETSLELGSAEAPAVLFITSGDIELQPDADAGSTELSAGEAVEVSGEFSITAGAEGATFVAGVVGPEVPPLPVIETPAPETATVTVQALACPVGYEDDNYAADCTEPLADIGFVLFLPATEFSLEGATDETGTLIFEEVEPNTYGLAGGVPAEFATQLMVCANDEGQIPTEPTGSEVPGGTFEVAAGDEITCSWYVMPVDLQGEPSTPVGGEDADEDGLSDDEEAEIGTDPAVFDTDADRLSDGFEVLEFGTNPLLADSDEDGLGDGDELEVYGTDALSADTDGDGVDDATELDAGTDPTDPTSV